ncbi:MAG: diaminohydroxyphosphoribosylaminopyrimidine deaminase [Luteibaculaceae bacterium]|jgi:diaminohydroxyphosphoribosylaminopyrimidine deaminase/5-amino-6-(5-phosphoribosylamino)uracil reductase
MEHEFWMKRALELAEGGKFHASPNPLVGAVLVQDGQLISEGYHVKRGKGHAEVECLRKVSADFDLSKATLYVTLEPCAHFGLTPPCSHLIVSRNITKVVIATRDPFPQVNGQGIKYLKEQGVQVVEGIMEKEARWQNRRFITAHRLGRPYITLKWAESADGFIDYPRSSGELGSLAISSPESGSWTHTLRSQTDGIAIGTNTFITDNPSLATRHVAGPNPIPLVFSNTISDLGKSQLSANQESILLNDTNLDFGAKLAWVFQEKNITSVLVEGGAQLLQSCIDHSLWDECHIIASNTRIGDGLKAPQLPENSLLLKKSTIPTDNTYTQLLNPNIHDILNF